MFTHVVYINLQVMTNHSDQWFWLHCLQMDSVVRSYWASIDDTSREKQLNSSDLLALLSLSVLPSLLICPWIYSSNRGASMPSVSACTCTLQPRPRLAQQPGLERLPVWAGLNFWSGLVSWGDGSNAHGDSSKVWQFGFDLPDCKVYGCVFKTNSCSTYIKWSIVWVQHMSSDSTLLTTVRDLTQLCAYMWKTGCFQAPGGTALDHLIIMASRQGHSQHDHNLQSCTTPLQLSSLRSHWSFVLSSKFLSLLNMLSVSFNTSTWNIWHTNESHL